MSEAESIRGKRWIWIVGIILILAIGFVFYLGPRLVQRQSINNRPPTVFLNSPLSGDVFEANKDILALATITGTNPISRVEIWLDGSIISEEIPTQNSTTFNSFHQITIGEGVHMLNWRAVDSLGLVGQSGVIPISGEIVPGGDDTAIIEAIEGQTLDEIAEQEGFGSEVLRELNPELSDDILSGGTSVKVPLLGGQDEDSNNRVPDDISDSPIPEPPIGEMEPLPAVTPGFNIGSVIPGLVQRLPKAPQNLQAGFEDCKIRLVWTDHSTTEDNFVVWMQAVGKPPVRVITTSNNPGTGPSWLEFAAPGFGLYGVWVEAVNALGGQSSEVKGVFVDDDTCDPGFATQLEIELLNLFDPNNSWEEIYCYISIEDSPYTRFPEDDNAFFNDFVKKTAGGTDKFNHFLINIPADEEVTLDGDCWGMNSEPRSMGEFRARIPRDQWDGRVLTITGREYLLEYRIHPHGPTEPEVVFYQDPGIPIPQISEIIVKEGDTPKERTHNAKYPKVTIVWGGNRADIDGFTLYVNGTPYFLDIEPDPLNPVVYEIPYYQIGPLPSACGGILEFQVEANSGPARSGMLDPYIYVQPPCLRHAGLTFEGFTFAWLTGETANDCPDAEVRVRIFDNSVEHTYGLNPVPTVYCGVKYNFQGIQESSQYFPISPNDANGGIIIWIEFWERDDIFGAFVSYDPICTVFIDYQVPAMSDSEWANFEDRLQQRCPNIPMDQDGSAEILIRINGYLELF